MPLSWAIICSKTISLSNLLKDKSNGSNKAFVLSNGWFNCLKKQANLQNVKTYRWAAKTFLHHLEKFFEEGGFILSQIFNVDETGLLWKQIPSRF